MQIKGLEKELKKGYPKIDDISEEELSNNMPKKWRKSGLPLSLMALTPIDNESTLTFVTAGDEPTPPIYVLVSKDAFPISIFIFCISALSMIITLIKSKKQQKKTKIKTFIKVLFVLSFIISVTCIVINVCHECI